MDISPIFNVVDLYDFHEGEKSNEVGTLDECKNQLLVKPIEEVENGLATRVGKKNRQKEYLEYLIKWKNKGIEHVLWVSKWGITHLRVSSTYEVVTT